MDIFAYLYVFLGWIIRSIYELVHNYGLTIILFTIILKVLILPLSIKQVKSTSKMQLLQPEIAKIQEKYKNDKEKLQQEQMKLYQKYKINPASGCLPLLIQFPIIIGLYNVINEPLTYILNFTKNQIDALKGLLYVDVTVPTSQITIAQDMHDKLATLSNTDFANVTPIDFSFLGINLAATPSLSYINWLWLFPVLVYASTYYSAKIGMVKQKKPATNDDSAAAQMAKSSETMMKVMPVMTLFFAFSMPAGVSLYWIASSLFQMGQQYLLNKKYVEKNIEEGFVEQVEADLEAEKKAKKNRRR